MEKGEAIKAKGDELTVLKEVPCPNCRYMDRPDYHCERCKGIGDIEKLRIRDLEEGEIFKMSDKPWDSLKRFHSVHYYDDKEHQWVDAPNKNTRSCIWLSDVYFGEYEGCFWWNDDTEEVFIPMFPPCPYKKHLGKPYIPMGGSGRFHVFPYQLNKINQL